MEALRRLLRSLGGGLLRIGEVAQPTTSGGQEGQSSRTALLSATGLLLFAGSLVFLFLLSSQFYLRFDASSGGLYSLSPGSKRLLKDLRDPINIRAYFSKELPPQYAATRSYVKDILQEYRSASKGKVRFQFVDFEKDDKSKQDALGQGIAPIQFNVISKEKYEVREGFMGLILQHEDKKEVVPAVTEMAGLEYDLTSRMVRLTRDKRNVIGMLSSNGAFSPDKLHPRVRELIERNYELRGINLGELKSGTTIAADVSAMLVLGPTEKLSEDNLYALDQFLLSGRPLALGLDTRKTDLRQFFATDLDTGLSDFLAHHGVRIRKNMVMDLQSQKVSLAQQRGWFTLTNIIDYPPLVVVSDLSRSHPVTRDLTSLTLPFASPLEVSTQTSSGEVQILAKSSPLSWLPSSWAKGGFQSINPVQNFAPTAGDAKGPFVLAASIEDSFQSYFSTAAASAHSLPKGADASIFLARSMGKGRLLVVGTSRFVDPEMAARDTGPVFLLNLIDWLALDSDLTAIRSKGAAYRPLREVSAVYKKLIRWGAILGPSFLVVAFGIFRLYARRRLRRRRANIYTPVERPSYATQNA